MNRILKWRPNKRWLAIPPVLIGISVVVALANSQRPLPMAETVPYELPVSVTVVRESVIHPAITGYGTARPKRIWTAIPEVGGQAVEIHPMLRSGNEIEQGEILLSIDPADYQLRILQRESELKQANAELDQLVEGDRSDQESLLLQQSLLRVRQNEKDRLTQLRGNSAASQTESDNAQAAYLQQSLSVKTLERTIALTPAKIASAQAAIGLAESRLSEAKRDLERTTIRAPFDGLLSGVNLQPRQYVPPGQQLFELRDATTIEVEAQFSLAQMSKLVAIDDEIGNDDSPRPIKARELLSKLAANVTVRSGDVAVEFLGKPVRASATIDQETRTIGIVVEVTAAGKLDKQRTVALRSGAYCEVVLSIAQPIKGITVPRTAVRKETAAVADHDQGQNVGNASAVDEFVLLVNQQDELERRRVQTQISIGRNLVVTGLVSGDRLVAQPPLAAAEGVRVRVTNKESAQ